MSFRQPAQLELQDEQDLMDVPSEGDWERVEAGRILMVSAVPGERASPISIITWVPTMCR